MRNTIIFTIILLALVCTAIYASTDRSSSATINGRFDDCISKIDYQWAYLQNEETKEVLDSCLVTEHRFTLTSNIPKKGLTCAVAFSYSTVRMTLNLTPRKTIALNIISDPEQYMHEMLDKLFAVQDSLARLQADSLLIVDSLRRADI